MEHPNLDFIKNMIETEYNAEGDYSVNINETDPEDPRLILYTYGSEDLVVEIEFKLYGGEQSGILLVCSLFNAKNGDEYAIRPNLLQDMLILVNNANFQFASMIGRLSVENVHDEYLVLHNMKFYGIPSEPNSGAIRPVIKNIMENYVIGKLAAPLSLIIDEIEETYKQPWVLPTDEETDSETE